MPGTCFSQDGRPGQNPGSFQLLWAHSWCLHCLSGDHHGWVMLRALSLLSPPSPPSLQHLPPLHQSLISFSLPIPLQIPCRCGSLTFFSFPVPTDHPPWWVHILQASGSALPLSTAAVSHRAALALGRQSYIPALPSISYPHPLPSRFLAVWCQSGPQVSLTILLQTPFLITLEKTLQIHSSPLSCVLFNLNF